MKVLQTLFGFSGTERSSVAVTDTEEAAFGERRLHDQRVRRDPKNADEKGSNR